MRTTIGAVLASALLFGSSTGASPQSMDEERAAIRAHVRNHSRGSILARTLVLNAPFSGEVETTWRQPSSRGRHAVKGTARYYRDSIGRVRIEQPLLGDAGNKNRHRIIMTPDPTKAWAYLLDPAARAAWKIGRLGVPAGGAPHLVLPVTVGCVIEGFRPGLRRPLEEESLGEETMSGVRVEGTRIRGILGPALGRGETIDERWFSPELQLELYARSEDGKIGVFESRMTISSRADPPAALFEIPADYEVDVPNGGATGLNPYTAPRPWSWWSPAIKENCGPARPPGF
jgi:hypothetical protein